MIKKFTLKLEKYWLLSRMIRIQLSLARRTIISTGLSKLSTTKTTFIEIKSLPIVYRKAFITNQFLLLRYVLLLRFLHQIMLKSTLLTYLDSYLKIADFDDESKNGLQVDSDKQEIKKI